MKDGATYGVSRETCDKLRAYGDLLEKWGQKINLVSRKTLPDRWDRHIIDSLQLVRLIERPVKHWLDLGTGAGLPGLVVAIAFAEKDPDTRFTLIDSDARKCAFLQAACAALDLRPTILTTRIEDAPPQNADVISARALAPLPELVRLSTPHLSPDGDFWFLKGVAYQEELTRLPEQWHTRISTFASKTDPTGTILRIKGTPDARN